MNHEGGECEKGVLFNLLRTFQRVNNGMKISSRNTIEFKNFAIFTILFDTKQNLTLCVSSFPAGSLWIEISRAMRKDILRTI